MLVLPDPAKIIVFTLLKRDQELVGSFLARPGLEFIPVSSLADCEKHLAEGADAFFITEEIIQDSATFIQLAAAVAKEPEWSDLPVIALVNATATRELVRHYENEFQAINITLIQRPVRSEVLARILSSALRARARQYQVRDFLQEKLRAQETMWRTQKLESIGILAGGIAHDFNNLLTGILGNISLLTESLTGQTKLLEYAEQAITSAEKAADLTKQLLAYSGRGTLIKEPLDMSSLISQTVQLIRASVPSRVELSFELEKHLPPVIGDRVQLEQIIMNLVINASEAVPEGTPGRVCISTCIAHLDDTACATDGLQAGKYARILVSDTGVGISEETMSRLFEPFFTTKFIGRGLGLSAVQGIVRAHAGRISVQSTLGQGTQFTVMLPVSDEIAYSPAKPSAKASISGTGHILVVDDEQMIRDVGKSILEQLGYQVSLASDGKEALEKLSNSIEPKPDLMILDWTMPVMDGAAVLSWLNENRPDFPVLIATGFGESAARDTLGVQVTDILQKPFSRQKLGEAVQKRLSDRR